jgi:hypothetical protein
MGRRSDAEAANRQIDDQLYLRRARSLGVSRQLFDVLAHGLVQNSVALRTPPGTSFKPHRGNQTRPERPCSAVLDGLRLRVPLRLVRGPIHVVEVMGLPLNTDLHIKYFRDLGRLSVDEQGLLNRRCRSDKGGLRESGRSIRVRVSPRLGGDRTLVGVPDWRRPHLIAI